MIPFLSQRSRTPATPRNPVYLIPIEIWDVILDLACDPRGLTAAAISRVSRYFNNAIKPRRLSSLVIYGESQIVAFHRAMKVMPLDVPRANHLYIGLIPDSYARGAHQVCHSVIDGWIQDLEETQDQRDRRISQHSKLSTFGPHPGHYVHIQWDDVGGIISHHRETLQTLTYLTTGSVITPDVFGWLPRLKDLTIVCLRYKSMFRHVGINHPLHQTTQFPILERLHLSYFNTKPLFDHDEFRRVAPKLTHFRISGRKCYLKYEKLPLRTKILIQPILLSSQEQEPQLRHLREILSVPSYEKRTVLLEPGHREDQRYGFFDALLDWLDVSAGGSSFWGRGNEVTVNDLAAR